MARACFPMFPSFQHGKYCFQCQFLFSRCKLCLRYTAGNFNENPSMRAVAKILRARASEHSSNFWRAIWAKAKFCEHFQTGWDHSIPLLRTCVYCYTEACRKDNRPRQKQARTDEYSTLQKISWSCRKHARIQEYSNDLVENTNLQNPHTLTQVRPSCDLTCDGSKLHACRLLENTD